MNDEERLEELEKVLDALTEMTGDYVILVEGNKDVAALKSVGVGINRFFTEQFRNIFVS